MLVPRWTASWCVLLHLHVGAVEAAHLRLVGDDVARGEAHLARLELRLNTHRTSCLERWSHHKRVDRL